MSYNFKFRLVCQLVVLAVFFLPGLVSGQIKTDSTSQSYLYFPYPMQAKKWHSSIGFSLTLWPQDISEEAQVRAPAGDYHVIRKIDKGFYLDGQLIFQVVQNHLSIGPRWAHVINNRFSFSLGDDIGWWFGVLKVGDFNTTANGWLNYPNISLGYRVKEQLLVTWKTEAIVNLSYHSSVGGLEVSKSHNTLSGWSTGIYLEQPFYKKKNLTLGLRAIYSNFYWQTWSLFETFDRQLFYPEITVGFIL
ncbi:hypothetical protein [Flavihumibacter profundi]|uniref:hypothetical protein n=1 Tax=Flavihumibacter profundi TaxID=2716883 RepID=UPI001CC3D485|nr:hypothetical protein [Flavihumibacter profundi]MBZ5856124.1 hypothetical protein [Flavihumibacter profundi]